MLRNLLSGGRRFLVIGGFLVTLGMVLAFAMILEYIPTTFVTAFLTYGASVAGLLTGVAGAALVSAESRQDR
ncbi:MAG: hypothetical protein KIS85_03740 [Anaerolineales bacterium]|nr:hypothetical protein [Anaerolineales bacterium]